VYFDVSVSDRKARLDHQAGPRVIAAPWPQSCVAINWRTRFMGDTWATCCIQTSINADTNTLRNFTEHEVSNCPRGLIRSRTMIHWQKYEPSRRCSDCRNKIRTPSHRLIGIPVHSSIVGKLQEITLVTDAVIAENI